MTTLNLVVGASSDDAFEGAGGAPNVTSASIYLNFNSSEVDSGMRFTGVSGLSGATINSATLSGNVINTSNDDPATNLYFELGATPATFTTDDGSVDGRSLTTAFVSWSTTAVGAGIVAAPDLSTPLTEVAGSFDPSELVIIADGSAGSGTCIFTSYDSNPSTAPKLDIDYTAGGAPSGNPHYYYAQQ